ncbi:MAG: hypothetical protein HUJ26_09650 [Planctomycetaceae bacterium]|nr:hypothetical protein [Planctomycetaceae bacterium]
MAAYEFPCPVCSLTLRARDQTVAGQVIKCADCQTPLLVEQDGDGQLFARRQQTLPPLKTSKLGNASPDSSLSTKKFRTPRSGKLWGSLAGIGVVLIGGFFLMGRSTDESPADNRSVDQKPEVAQDPATPESSDKESVSNESNNKPNADTLYSDLDERIQLFQETSGVYPSPVISGPEDRSERFSWIASLESVTHPTQLQPLWDRAWDDPLNEHFVRRALPHWLNPAVSPKTSPNRFPATHFVGIAGIGKDAASLPSSDPRAGMFGDGRTLSPENLPAGAANVWMLSGVQEQIGAWAANGQATVRPWTGGPVIGGPDGFGTGQKDAMPILMADGSVRVASAQTAPDVLERLATIHVDNNDEVVVAKQDPTPITDPPEEPPSPQFAGQRVFQFPPLRAPKPPEAELEDLLALLKKDLGVKPQEPEPAQNVELQLAQKLRVFDLREPQPLQAVLEELSVMSGVPILISRADLGDAESKLDRRVTLSLIETTLKDVLIRLLQEAELGYRIDSGRIRITSEPLTAPE